MTRYRARWVLPIDQPPLRDGWVDVADGRIAGLGAGTAPGAAAADTRDLGEVALVPGLVNAHTHLELSWMAGLVPPAASMHEWIGALMRVRFAGPKMGSGRISDDGTGNAARPHFPEPDAARAGAALMRGTGTVLVGDITNSLITPPILAEAGIGGVVFHELLGFSVSEPHAFVRAAAGRASAAAAGVANAEPPIRVTLAAHAPYSVSPALFREIAAQASGPLAVHLGESPEEVEFLRSGLGPIRQTLESLGVWNGEWRVPECDPVSYIADLGYLQPGALVVHGVHLTDDALERLRDADATLITCPRSNLWVGAGPPRLSHFYACGVPVAVGTDSLASVATLNLWDELAEMRRLAPDVAPECLLESATRIGAEALGFGDDFGTITAGKRAALVAVDVPAAVSDVEEYLVSGVPADCVRRVA